MTQAEQMQEWIDHHSKRADRAEAINAELLEALKWCVRHLELIAERDYPESDEKGRRFTSTSIALAAIAKATGGAQ